MSKGFHSKGIDVTGIADNRTSLNLNKGKPERLIGISGWESGDFRALWMTPKRCRKIINKLKTALAAVERGEDYHQ